MIEKRRFMFLNGLIIGLTFLVLGLALVMLYRTAVDEERHRLTQIVRSQARHIEAMARFARNQKAKFHPQIGDPTADTLDQLIDAHDRFKGFGQTGEFTLAKKAGDEIVFLLRRRHFGRDNPPSIRFDSALAEPMRLALKGKSGSIIGPDYRGRTVLAAYEPVAELNWGIVAKVDMMEIRAPFIKTGLVSIILAIALTTLATFIFYKITVPIIRRLESDKNELERINDGLTVAIKQRERAENELEQSEKLRRALIDHARDAIFLFDGTDGTILEANRSAQTMLGRSLEEIKQMFSWDLFIKEEADIARKRRSELIQFKEVGLQEYHILSKAGHATTVEAKANIIESDDRKLVIGIYRDIEERIQSEKKRRLLETQLQQSQKLEAIGRLAGGVAHDFNNLLSIIIGYSELGLEALDAANPHHEGLTEIHAAAVRAQHLTQQLLAFGRKQTLEVKILDMNGIVQDFEKMIRRVIGEDITLKMALAKKMCCVRADASQLEQVLMNLSVNARDAMPNGGTITIETAIVELDENYASQKSGVTPGQYVMLGISDTGEGMDRATAALIFEPFFTTKRKGKGTGLGLATVFGIVKQHGGNIWVYSEPGQGTAFKIYLPHIEEKPDLACRTTAAATPGSASGVVLVVEDDPALRRVACNILREKGYEVMEAADTADAVNIAKGYIPGIDLLLTDVVMPDMKGPEVHRRVAEFHPGLKVLYMSGYTDNVIADHGVLKKGINFLQKPFSANTLAAKVHEVLTGD